MTPILRFARLPNAGDLPAPERASKAAAGLDLRSAAAAHLAPRSSVKIPTGFAVAIPIGFEGQIRSRSGLAIKGVQAHPGTIDPDYRGELMVILFNHGDTPLEINRGDRIAQLVVAPIATPIAKEVPALDETERGSGGFGSTGVR